MAADSSKSRTPTTRANDESHSDAPLPGSRDNQVSKTDAADSDGKPAAANSSDPTSVVRWYGHAFIYVISSTGVRIAMDPFTRGTVKYLFPARLPADVVLISSSDDDHAAGEQLFGAPLIFRSYTAIGLNKANGSIFKGVAVSSQSRRDPNAGQCTAFVFTVDGVTFAHLGVIGDILDSRQRQDLGRVDVLFLPIGNTQLSIADLNGIAADLKAKIIIPITYKTDMTPDMNLRTLDEYLKGQKLPIKRLDKPEFLVDPALLPSQPTIYVPTLP